MISDKIVCVNLEQANQKGAIGTHTRGIVNAFSFLHSNHVITITDQELTSIDNKVQQYFFDDIKNKFIKRLKGILYFSKIYNLICINSSPKTVILLYTRFHFWTTPIILLLAKKITKKNNLKLTFIVEYNDIIIEQINYMITKKAYGFLGRIARNNIIYKNIIQLLEKRVFNNTNIVVCVTNSLTDYVRKLAPRATSLCVQNAADHNNINLEFKPNDLFVLRKNLALDVNENLLYICHAGTLTAWDGLEHLIHAISKCKIRNFLRLIIIGDGVVLNELNNH